MNECNKDYSNFKPFKGHDEYLKFPNFILGNPHWKKCATTRKKTTNKKNGNNSTSM
jgi:hypothetical protein